MLTEVPNCRQIKGEPERRWFSCETMDLIVWYSSGSIIAFQLCYDKMSYEHALTWREESGFSHNKVDTGEMYGFLSDRLTPILISDGSVRWERIQLLFSEASGTMDSTVAEFVMLKLSQA